MLIINTPRKYNYSRTLDINLNTDHPAITKLVDAIFKKYFNTKKKDITKKHLKVLLLDLYVAWNTDPKLEINFHMSLNYTSIYRYNQPYITKKMNDVITVLRNQNVICFQKVSETNYKVTRIWTSSTLESYFKRIRLSIFDIYHLKETIVLKGVEKKALNYKVTNKIKDMRKVLKKYNEILTQCFIDIPFLEKTYLEYKGRKHYIDHHSKFVRRIFSKGSFDKGGKFSGGWWQLISEKQRENILIDDRETIEIDYKSLHPVLAYAQKGIDFWKITNTTKYSCFNDSYDVPTFGIKDKEDSRAVVKLLFLTALNSKNEKECFEAFRNQWNYEEHSYQGFFTDIFLRELLDSIRDRHYQIDDLFCSGIGIDIEKWESDIVEYIISDFTERNIPILYVHDSFIIWKEQVDLLVNNMNTAIKWIAEDIVENVKLAYDQLNILAWKDHRLCYISKKEANRNDYLESIPKLPLTFNRCKNYLERWKQHKKYFFEKYN